MAPRGLFWLPGVLVDSQRLWLTPRGLGWLPGALVDSQRPVLAPRGLGSLPEVLVGSQGPWLAPRGLGWLPEVLVGSQGSCLAPKSFGAATHCGSLMATFSFQHHQRGFLPITIPCLLLSHRLPSLLAPMFLPKAEDINIDTLASIIFKRILRESPLTYNMLKEILKP